MLKNSILAKSVRFALVAGTASTAFALPVAYAAEEAPAADKIEKIEVTGSRIQRANVVTSSPVTTVTAEDIKASGVTKIEDLLNEMPQVFAAQNSTVSNGSSGTATVDLRGLGSNRTLVLINGRRMPAGTPGGSTTADLNSIPANLVERVEILTGGSSATYGADAVAGVVNFIMKDDFEGVQFDYQYSLYQHDNDNEFMSGLLAARKFNDPKGNVTDGDTHDFSLLVGGNFADDKGNATAYASVRSIDAVLQADRDYSACALGAHPTTGVTRCAGSGTTPEGQFTNFDTFQYSVEGDQFVPYKGPYNYGPTNYFQRPDERRSFGVNANYQINDKVELYTELSLMDDRTVAQIAPSGNFFVTSTLRCDNPLLSNQQFNELCGKFGLTKSDIQNVFIGRRNVEGGPRQDDLRHTAYRGVLGIKGDINDSWQYDVYANYGTTDYIQTYLNDMSTSRIKRALDVTTDKNGNIVCRSVVEGYDTACVPWNIFKTGGVTQEALDYLIMPLFARGDTASLQMNGYVSGDLTDNGWVMPTATDGLAVVFGVEHRKESMNYKPDNGFQSGDGAGQGGPRTGLEGSYDVNDFYGEAQLPVLQDLFLAQDLTLEAAYRYSDYSTDNQTNTYKVGMNWALIDDIRIRASMQRAVRAPNIGELFASESLSLFNWKNDPCAGATPSYTAEECARTGVSAAQYGKVPSSPAGQYNQFGGGNPDLEPESSDTLVVGVAFTPTFLENFSVAVDYYDISIEDAVGSIPADEVVRMCAKNINPSLCSQIKRRAGTGDLWVGSDASSGRIESGLINTGSFVTKGVDLDAAYMIETGLGDVRFGLIGTYLDSLQYESYKGAAPVECAGVWDRSTCGQPSPTWRHVFSTNWSTNWDLDLGLRWRYFAEADELSAKTPVAFDAISYVDLVVGWQALENTNFQFGVNNVMDKEPQIVTDTPSGEGNGNTFPGVYDALGRYIYAGVTVKF